MRRFLAAQFAPVLRAWRNGYEAEVRRAAIAFFLVFLAFGVCLAVPELRLGFSAYLQHLFQGMDLTDGAGNLSPLLLLANNLRACAVTMLYGLIPFVRLPALALGVNAVLLGGLAACYAATDTTMLLYAASLLPHGIFELPALILAFSLTACGKGEESSSGRVPGAGGPAAGLPSAAAADPGGADGGLRDAPRRGAVPLNHNPQKGCISDYE